MTRGESEVTNSRSGGRRRGLPAVSARAARESVLAPISLQLPSHHHRHHPRHLPACPTTTATTPPPGRRLRRPAQSADRPQAASLQARALSTVPPARRPTPNRVPRPPPPPLPPPFPCLHRDVQQQQRRRRRRRRPWHVSIRRVERVARLARLRHGAPPRSVHWRPERACSHARRAVEISSRRSNAGVQQSQRGGARAPPRPRGARGPRRVRPRALRPRPLPRGAPAA